MDTWVTWCHFTRWAQSKEVRLSRAKGTLEVPRINFLQEDLDKGFATNTLKRQMAAITSMLGVGLGISITTHPHIKYCNSLGGRVCVWPCWNLLYIVFPPWIWIMYILTAVMYPLFKHLLSVAFRELSYETLFSTRTRWYYAPIPLLSLRWTLFSTIPKNSFFLISVSSQATPERNLSIFWMSAKPSGFTASELRTLKGHRPCL